MTAARKIKNPAPAKPKLEVVPPKAAPKAKNPRRRHKRRRNKKGLSTGAKVAIGAAIVLVGIPMVLFTVGAIGVGIAAKHAVDDMNTPTPTPQFPTTPI